MGDEDSYPEVAGGVEGVVAGCDAVKWGGRGRGGFEVE